MEFTMDASMIKLSKREIDAILFQLSRNLFLIKQRHQI